MKKNTIILVYGSGGHKEQMKRLYQRLYNHKLGEIEYIGFCEPKAAIEELNQNYEIKPLRDKYSLLKTAFQVPISILTQIYYFFKIIFSRKVKLIISTGPGIIIIPAILSRILNKRIIFIETWSRFETASITGKIMYHIAHDFYIQNPQLKKHYPNAKYSGLL